ncbi:MAG: acyltransferase family protein, partial [Chitinophagaceae bacterium]
MEPELKPVAPRYLPYLDSARGIAALMVLFGHYTGWKFNSHPVIRVTNFIFNAPDAVSFFFVLSGMVLTYQYLVLDKKLDIRKYYVNRFLRLFPAFFITVLLNALYWQRHNFGLYAIYHDIFLGNNGFWKEAVLVRPATQFYIPGWTLVIELSVSFFIPYLIVLARVNRQLLWWLILSSLLVARIMDAFVMHFILGVALSAYYFYINSPEFKCTRWYRFRHIILLLSIVLFSIRRIQDV